MIGEDWLGVRFVAIKIDRSTPTIKQLCGNIKRVMVLQLSYIIVKIFSYGEVVRSEVIGFLVFYASCILRLSPLVIALALPAPPKDLHLDLNVVSVIRC